MRLIPTIFLTALALLPALPAQAGRIRGTLHIGPVSAARGDAASAQSVRDAVIYVEHVPAKVEKKLANPGFLFFRSKPRLPRVVQMDRRFNPRVISIVAGSRVAFHNMDQVWHNTFSVSATRTFDLGKYPPGWADTIAFERPGVVNLHCDIHSSMVGFVVVTPNHAFTRPDSAGTFRLPSLPPGRYTVRAVHPRHGELRRDVVMPKRGDLKLDLRF